MTKNKYLYILIMTLTLLTACSKKLIPINKEDTIVAFGDSLTFGYGANENDSYPAQLKKITGYKIINEGLNGDTARNGTERIKDAIIKNNPKVIILSLGGNDMLKKDMQTLKEDLNKMIVYAKSKNIQVILLAEPQPSILALTMGLNDADIYKVVAKEQDLLLLDNIYSKYLSKEEFKSDIIHLNSKGYRLVAEDIAIKLKKANLINY